MEVKKRSVTCMELNLILNQLAILIWNFYGSIVFQNNCVYYRLAHWGRVYSGIWILMSPSLINAGLNFEDLNIFEDLISSMPPPPIRNSLWYLILSICIH